jgi:hypothetical protein
MHAETVDARLIAAGALGRNQIGEHLKEDTMERRTKVGAVNRGVTRRLRIVDILALGAVESDSALVGNIVQAHREEVLTLAQNAGAFAEVAIFVLFSLGEERRGQLLIL